MQLSLLDKRYLIVSPIALNFYLLYPVVCREPEKRPAAIVSNVFTILCIAPFVIMLLMWLKLGINVSNFPMSLSALGFHIGLTGDMCSQLEYSLDVTCYTLVWISKIVIVEIMRV